MFYRLQVWQANHRALVELAKQYPKTKFFMRFRVHVDQSFVVQVGVTEAKLREIFNLVSFWQLSYLWLLVGQSRRVAQNETELCEFLNVYLKDPALDAAERRKFIEDETTFTDGTSGRRTAEYILKVLEKSNIGEK